MNTTYQSHLDALRALAITLVLLFHLDVPGFESGYLGVDIFFVLSGYLMTHTMLLRREKEGRFKIGDFFLRRFRRIAPSLLITILVSLILAFVLMSPPHLKDTVKQALSSQFFVSNIFFYQQSGYFAPENSIRMLLHTWSLSVEEQFYLFFGLLLWLGNKYRFSKICLAVAIVSTALALVAYWAVFFPNGKLGFFSNVKDIDAMVFYLAPFRVFQFFAGVIVAIHLYKRQVTKETLLGGLGIALFIAVALLLQFWAPAKNMASLLVMLSVPLLLYKSSILTTIGSLSSVQFIARISYQVYLTHWPLIVSWKYWTLHDLSAIETSLLLIGSLLSGWALFHLSRVAVFIATQPRALVGACTVIAIPCLILDGIGYSARGARWRIPAERSLYKEYKHKANENAYCNGTEFLDGVELGGRGGEPLVTCARKMPGNKSIYVWGDSHAKHILPGLSENFPNHNIEIMYFSECVPQIGQQKFVYPGEGSRKAFEACADRNNRALAFFENSESTNIVIHQYAGYRRDDETSQWYAASKHILDKLTNSGHNIVWIGSVIHPGKSILSCRNVPMIFSDKYLDKRCLVDQKVAEMTLNKNLKLKSEFSSRFVNVNGFFCKTKAPETCVVAHNGQVLFRDSNHLTTNGSIMMIKHIKDQLKIPE